MQHNKFVALILSSFVLFMCRIIILARNSRHAFYNILLNLKAAEHNALKCTEENINEIIHATIS